MNTVLSSMALVLLGSAAEVDGQAAIVVYNPTRCDAPAVVEVPTGRLAAPGLIDWTRARLVSGKEVIPFAIRRGGFPWQKDATPDAATPPRAEDLLVFACAVKPGTTKRVEIVEGVSVPAGPVSRAAGRLIVDFPAVRASFEESTGRLNELSFRGESALTEPLEVTFQRLQTPGYTLEGGLGPGYQTPRAVISRADDIAYEAQFVGHTSSSALVEARWILTPAEGPEMLLTYRVYAQGTVEILADDRPWDGPSPWVSHAVSWALPLRGETHSIPTLETRFPFYGFKDFTTAFPQVGRTWQQGTGGLVEIGEQAVNGRRFYRKLVPFDAANEREVEDLIELVDEGLVAVAVPVSVPLAGDVVVSAPAEAAAVAAKLQSCLERQGRVVMPAQKADRFNIQLTLSADPSGAGIAGDGFVIGRQSGGGVEVLAGTVLGLRQAVQAIEDHITLQGHQAGVPLVAANPIVALRGGGFGGGNFEVDFPYGSLAQWQHVLDKLLDSGMNVLTCLGMWGNWKMPVSYRYMPELVSDDPEAYDESSGTLLSEVDAQRERGLHLLRHVQRQGGQVWLWLPIGCVPTTFAKAFPEAMMPGAVEEFWGRPKGTPCFTHARYHAYLDALLRELVETYPVDGLMLVRDDNGRLCSCDRCQTFVAASRTRHAAWEQYLMIYDRLRALKFQGGVAVYPYFDGYSPDLEDVLPADLNIVGHGASIAGLSRQYDRVGHMPDTWLDSLFTNFRLPPTPRVRRLLGDRSTFWIGGAYGAAELPWESIGHFGWEPTATPNTFRHLWGARTFGVQHAPAMLTVSNLYEDLWEINARYMVPKIWLETPPAERAAVLTEAVAKLDRYDAALVSLRTTVNRTDQDRWFGQMGLFVPLLRYHLHRLDRFAASHELVAAHKQAVVNGSGLPPEVRRAVLDNYASIYQYARAYDQALHAVPGAMLEATRHMVMPYQEWMAGYDVWLDPYLELPQFAGEIAIEVPDIQPGQPFTLKLTLRNKGLCPWVSQARQRVALEGIATKLGLPEAVTYDGAPIAPGESGTLRVEGMAPQETVKGTLSVRLCSASRLATTIAEASVEVTSR